MFCASGGKSRHCVERNNRLSQKSFVLFFLRPWVESLSFPSFLCFTGGPHLVFVLDHLARGEIVTFYENEKYNTKRPIYKQRPETTVTVWNPAI